MHRILQDIIKNTNNEVKKRENESSIEDLTSYEHIPFKGSILNPKTGDIGLIAEVKLASPTEGELGKKADILNRLQDYQAAGADAVSVVTEKKTFKGSLDLVSKLKRSLSNLPILQKDFIISDFQIEESRKLGADALLLIARIIDDGELKRFVKLCRGKSLEPVVEVCSLEDLAKAIESGTEIIAVNARDLDTFEVNVDRACELLKKLPEKFIKLGFSGIHSRAEVIKYKDAGAKAVLVGTELMKANDINGLIKTLKMPVKVKICGIRTLDAAKTAVNAGADFLGFNFVPTSKRYLSPSDAARIINAVKGKVKIVGVFQDEQFELVNNLTLNLGLDFVQLHGAEDDKYMLQMDTSVIKSIALNDRVEKIKADYLLLDRPERGKGKMVDLEKATNLATNFPLFIAGGLTPDNVALIVKKVKPFAVDVAGGVETNGYQDPEKIKQFIKNVKGIAP